MSTRSTRMPLRRASVGNVTAAVPVERHAWGRVMPSSVRLARTGFRSHVHSAECSKAIGRSARCGACASVTAGAMAQTRKATWGTHLNDSTRTHLRSKTLHPPSSTEVSPDCIAYCDHTGARKMGGVHAPLRTAATAAKSVRLALHRHDVACPGSAAGAAPALEANRVKKTAIIYPWAANGTIRYNLPHSMCDADFIKRNQRQQHSL